QAGRLLVRRVRAVAGPDRRLGRVAIDQVLVHEALLHQRQGPLLAVHAHYTTRYHNLPARGVPPCRGIRSETLNDFLLRSRRTTASAWSRRVVLVGHLGEGDDAAQEVGQVHELVYRGLQSRSEGRAAIVNRGRPRSGPLRSALHTQAPG